VAKRLGSLLFWGAFLALLAVLDGGALRDETLWFAAAVVALNVLGRAMSLSEDSRRPD
jgi:hypothetical protein